MGRVYSATFSAVAVSAQQDFFELAPADDKPIVIHGFTLGQTSDYKDAEDEGMQVSVIRGHTTSGSGGSTATARPALPNDTACAFTPEINNTTIASAGTSVTLSTHTFNVRAGIEFFYPPECRPVCSQAEGLLVLRSGAAPADALTMNGTIWFEELV